MSYTNIKYLGRPVSAETSPADPRHGQYVRSAKAHRIDHGRRSLRELRLALPNEPLALWNMCRHYRIGIRLPGRARRHPAVPDVGLRAVRMDYGHARCAVATVFDLSHLT